jgi:hypothetical protein
MNLRLTLSLFALGLVCSCATLNVSSTASADRQLDVELTLPPGLNMGQPGTVVTTIRSGTAPYTISYEITPGWAEPARVGPRPINGERRDAQTFTFLGSNISSAGGTVTVTVRDSRYLEGTARQNFTLPLAHAEPYIEDLSFAVSERTVTVRIGNSIPHLADAVSVRPQDIPPGLRIEPDTLHLPTGLGVAVFKMSLTQPFTAAGGTLSFFVEDSNSSYDTASIEVSLPPLELESDTLYAIPLQATAAVDETVTVVVATSATVNPFLFMSGCRLCAPVESDFDYVPGTFNIGAQGGTVTAVDGIWAAVDPVGTPTFINPSDFIARSDAGDGRWGIDVNVTPVDGTAVIGTSGELFNIGVSFGRAGTWQLTFQQFETVNRTYYQDASQTPDYFWADSSNNHPGIPNSVVVQ